MREDGFSLCHPAVNFLFFAGAIGFGAVLQHPAYCAAGCIGAAAYYVLLAGRRCWRLLGDALGLALFIALLNPFLNSSGRHVVFRWFGRPWTLEALYYGLSLGAIMFTMLVWFGCYSIVLTGDKFTALFGRLIPSLSLLLVMVLRMIPAFTRKARQILDARRAIGRGVNSVPAGAAVLSGLTDWALEGSIITADSMRSRGYGTGKRTHFRLYRLTLRDCLLLGLLAGLELAVILCGSTGAVFVPRVKLDPIGPGLAFYCLFLLVPTLISLKEAIVWRFLTSGI